MPDRARTSVVACALALLAGLRAQRPELPSTTDRLGGHPLAAAPFGPQQLAGDLVQHTVKLAEVSGLAASSAHPGTLWAIADGERSLFAIDCGRDARVRGVRATSVDGVRLYDWEDLASFSLGGRDYLLIADTGTNALNGRRRTHRGQNVAALHVVPEPRPGAERIEVASTITFALDNAADDDIEAVAVDEARGEILVLEKRRAPPRLLVLPLETAGDAHHDVTAADWQAIALPEAHPWERQQRNRRGNALQTSYRRQPTALAVRGAEAVVLTYRHAYLFRRAEQMSWPQAMARTPRQIALPFSLRLDEERRITVPAGATPVLPQREAVCFAADGNRLFVASEARGAVDAAWLVHLARTEADAHGGK